MRLRSISVAKHSVFSFASIKAVSQSTTYTAQPDSLSHRCVCVCVGGGSQRQHGTVTGVCPRAPWVRVWVVFGCFYVADIISKGVPRPWDFKGVLRLFYNAVSGCSYDTCPAMTVATVMLLYWLLNRDVRERAFSLWPDWRTWRLIAQIPGRQAFSRRCTVVQHVTARGGAVQPACHRLGFSLRLGWQLGLRWV